MARKITAMRKVRDILRLRFEARLSYRDIGNCLSLGSSTVSELVSRFTSSDLSWPLGDDFSDKQLEVTLYPSKVSKRSKRLPDFITIRNELKRKGMTKLLL